MLREFLVSATGTAIGLLALAAPVLANPFTFSQKLTIPDGEVLFGGTIDIDGNYALVNASNSHYLLDITTGNFLHEFSGAESAALDGNYALIGD